MLWDDKAELERERRRAYERGVHDTLVSVANVYGRVPWVPSSLLDLCHYDTWKFWRAQAIEYAKAREERDG